MGDLHWWPFLFTPHTWQSLTFSSLNINRKIQPPSPEVNELNDKAFSHTPLIQKPHGYTIVVQICKGGVLKLT